MMHGFDWNGENLRGRALSEKFHGCRGYWDGQDLWTRGGRIVRVSAAWRAVFPSCALDGEVFAGYGRFAEAADAVKHHRFTQNVHFQVFDVPGGGVWSERMALARSLRVKS